MQNEVEIESFVNDLLIQKEKYYQMIVIAKDQQKAIDRNDMESLANFLEKKRILLAEIEAIDHKVAKIKTNWAVIRGTVNMELRNKIEGIVGGIGKMLKELIVLEEAGKNSLEVKKGLVSSELKDMQMKKKVKNIYKQKTDEQNMFLDSGDI